MPVAPSFQDLLDVGQAEAQARRPDLTFFDDDITTAQNHAAAAMGDRVVQFGAEAFRATFLDGAKGDDLTGYVSDRYGIERKLATSAQVTVRLTRTSGGAAGTIAAGTRVATAFDPAGNQIVFTTDGAVSVGLGANGPFSVVATAADTGTAGNVAAGTIGQILDPLFDTTFGVTNLAAAGGGNLVESDEELRRRARVFFETVQRGTLAALEYGALLINSVREATAIESPGTFAVRVLVSDEDGGSSAQMVSDVAAEIENWRAAGTLVQVIGGQTMLVDLDIRLVQIRPGFDPADAEQAIIDIVTARLRRLRTEGTLFLDTVIAAVIAVAPDDIFDVEFTQILVNGVPAAIGDVVPISTVTLRAGTITVSGP